MKENPFVLIKQQNYQNSIKIQIKTKDYQESLNTQIPS